MLDFRNLGGFTTKNATAKDQIDHYMMTLDERMRAKGFNPSKVNRQTYFPDEYNKRTPENPTRDLPSEGYDFIENGFKYKIINGRTYKSKTR